MKIGIKTKLTGFCPKKRVAYSRKILLTFNLRRYKQSIVKNIKEKIIKMIPIIILKAYLPYQPVGLSTRRSIPEIKRIALPKAIATVDIILGQHCTIIIHRIPMHKANISDKRITS